MLVFLVRLNCYFHTSCAAVHCAVSSVRSGGEGVREGSGRNRKGGEGWEEGEGKSSVV